MIKENKIGVPCVGSIVQSVAGRDKKRCFVIVGFEYTVDKAIVYIADGALHKLECPKKKNIRHLRFVALGDEGTAVAIERGEMTNRALRSLLREKGLLYVNDRRDCSAEG